jgi:hypothetical protein
VTVRLWGGRHFVDFDGGGHQIRFMAYEVSAEEAHLAQRSERDTYLVILRCQSEVRRLIIGADLDALTAS